MENAVRAFIHYAGNWVDALRPVGLALNTASSVALGTSPWRVTLTYEPALPLTRALEGEQGDEARQETEPIEFESTDLAETLKMFENIRGIQKEMHKKYMVECRKRAKGKTEYELRQYVLVWYPRTANFEECWRGPYLVAEKEGENIYIIEDLLTHEKMRMHVNRMHDF